MIPTNLQGYYGWYYYHENGFDNRRFTQKLLPSLTSPTSHIAVLSSNIQCYNNEISYLKIKDLTYKSWCFPNTFIITKEENELINSARIIQEEQVYFMDGASILVSYLLDLDNQSSILDTCAAPGGKSLIFSFRISRLLQLNTCTTDKNNVLLVCNEYNYSRLQRLKTILNKHLGKNLMNQLKIELIRSDASDISLLRALKKKTFNRILLDAPCTSDRHLLLNKSIQNWSLGTVKKSAKKQLEILSNIYPLLEKGGILLYCTCALSLIENDDVISKFCKKFRYNPNECLHDLSKVVSSFNNRNTNTCCINLNPLEMKYYKQNKDFKYRELDELGISIYQRNKVQQINDSDNEKIDNILETKSEISDYCQKEMDLLSYRKQVCSEIIGTDQQNLESREYEVINQDLSYYQFFMEYTKYGAYILPDSNCGLGPLFISIITK
ncbi:NOL1 NOP2 SUN family protein [Cryptosporidium andersoni]|uniref:NOL1/NOP2/Sun domain family member 4 n=1 Tax=Cryptosporidium andersoni TaxID=117008 RepID=A0A1J4MVJ2_9CRYT|nr:NOL1 NOP2 SUN family protein [Cryptosporidium andersoni]